MRKRRGPELTDAEILFRCCLDVSWERKMREVGDAAIEVSLYKGKIVMSIPHVSEQAKKYQEATGRTLAGTAWLDDKSIDQLISMLRDAKKTYKKHLGAARVAAACDDCTYKVCAKHKHIFRGWKRGKRGIVA